MLVGVFYPLLYHTTGYLGAIVESQKGYYGFLNGNAFNPLLFPVAMARSRGVAPPLARKFTSALCSINNLAVAFMEFS